MADDSRSEALSELNLGIRELFRVLIPGAYTVIVFQWLRANVDSPLDYASVASGEMRTFWLVGVSTIVGLIAYGLQVHEKWAPYCDVFDHYRQRLNNAVREATAAKEAKNYVNEYKYFLETDGRHYKDRIHYFSSFYYMLDELSLISALGALAILARFFLKLNPDWPISARLIVAFLPLQLIGF